MNFSVIVTVGPAMLNTKKIHEIDSLGDCIYRVNGAHADAQQTTQIVKRIRSFIPDACIMVDLPGNKVRTNNIFQGIPLIKGETFYITDYQVNYPEFYRYLKRGDLVYANDSNYCMEVVDIAESTIKLLSHSDGFLVNNKGLHVVGIHNQIPFLFERDYELIRTACELQIDVVSLSFVRSASDIISTHKLIDSQQTSQMEVFAKVETAAALKNLDSILHHVHTINIDRGDLASDIGILNISRAQDTIVSAAKAAGKKIFLATQFLKNMELNPVPLISELTGLYQAISFGISGIQLSEETAVGKYPVECVKLVFDVYKNYQEEGHTI